MDDLQLNISVAIKGKKTSAVNNTNAGQYKFVSKPKFVGKTIARKRPQNLAQKTSYGKKSTDEPVNKAPQITESKSGKHIDLSINLRDLSENKGKYDGKNYQDISDDIQLKQKPRSGGWISSLFKNNPDVPRIGQRAIKPLVEKVFAGKTFSDLDIHPHSVANLQQNLGLKELMTVQQNAVPVLLQGRDVLLRSQTGSGKTLAYALPIIEGLQAIRPKVNRHDGVRAVIVVPTRELAVQTYELFIKLVKPFTWIVPGLLSGGQKRKAEKARLRKGLSILVGTPGRINDHLRHTQSLNFSKTSCLVLDEADCLLDMGYEKDVAAIVKAIEEHKKAATYDPMALVKQNIKKFDNEEKGEKEEDKTETEVKHHLTEIFLSKERQTVLLSATLTKAVENLAGLTLVDPVFVDTSEGRAVVADSLKTKININDPPTESPKDVKQQDFNENVTAKVKDENESKVEETRRGLKAFNGMNHRELFDSDNNTKEPEKSKQNIPDDSDSDSDYEYFKVQKQLEDKNAPEVEIEAEEDIKPSPAGGTFQEALKSAIIEDELILPATVNQTFLVVPMKLRLVTLCSLIIEHCVLNKKGGKMIVFMATLEMVDYHSELIETALTGKDVKVKKKSESTKKDSKAKKRKVDDDNNEYELNLINCPLLCEQAFRWESQVEEQRASMTLHESLRNHATKGEWRDLYSMNDKKCQVMSSIGRWLRHAHALKADSSSDASDEFEVDYQAPQEGGLVSVELEMFSLHGSMPHEQRMEVFKQFRKARNGVLICTDVAARGIDVPRVDLVLQYCAPASATDYVHRVGRTGRATQVGAAVLFLLPSETEFVRHLEQKRIRLRQSDEKQSLEPLRTIAPTANSSPRAAIALQTKLEQIAHSNKDWLARASRAYTSWVRFYSGYPRDVRPYLDAKGLHLGHAAKAFALRDTPAALARRTRGDPKMNKSRPENRLTVHEEEEKRRPGFSKVKVGSLAGRNMNKQSSMHTASEFDSGLAALDQPSKKKKKKLK